MNKFMAGLIGILLILFTLFVCGLVVQSCWGAERYSNAPQGKKSQPGERFAPLPIQTPNGVYDNAAMKRYFQKGRDPFKKPRGDR